jgi:hypothetical protein
MPATLLSPDVLQRLRSLTPGGHLCLFYRTADEQVAATTEYLAAGLRQRERCLYVADASALGKVRQALTAAGVDVNGQVQRGALVLLTAEQAYLRGGRFDVEGMIIMLKATVKESTAAGFTALRAAGDMSWLLDGAPGSEDAILYEAMMTQLYASLPAVGLCLYDRERLDPHVLEGALGTHPVVLTHDRCCDHNPFFEARDATDGRTPDARARFVSKLQQLATLVGGPLTPQEN